MRTARPAPPASALVVTLLTLSALSLMAATAATRIFPRLPIAYQNAAWQEARLAAEAGIDAGMADLQKNLTGPAPNTWPGWQEPPEGKHPLKELVASLASPVKLVTGLVGGLLGVPGPPGAVTVSDPIYLDNLKISAPAGIPTETDVQLWALQSSDAARIWFRMRSTATCALPPMAFPAPEKRDPALRRLSLRSVRPSLRKDMVGQPTTVPLPSVTRTVEVLVEPILPFELAIWSSDTLSLAPTGAWNVDSYDSSDLKKSASGAYPGRGSALAQANGHIACSRARRAEALYGPLIEARGARVSGAVATNGGDDPATALHENVAEAIGVDVSRIRQDFARSMSRIGRVLSGQIDPAPASGNFVAGTLQEPARYRASGDLKTLHIKNGLGLSQGLLVVYIDGDLDLAEPLIIPPAVTVVLYVRGNILLRENVNSGPWNSNRPGQLLIFGDAPGPLPQRLEVQGGASVCAAFYGPLCDISLAGSVNWCGSLAGRTFQVSSGGDGGVHYDEALATLGPPISFRIIRCVEDVRE